MMFTLIIAYPFIGAVCARLFGKLPYEKILWFFMWPIMPISLFLVWLIG